MTREKNATPMNIIKIPNPLYSVDCGDKSP